MDSKSKVDGSLDSNIDSEVDGEVVRVSDSAVKSKAGR